MSDHWAHPDPAIAELIEQAEARGAARADKAVRDVRRYAKMMRGSISVDRAQMARDILALLDGAP